MTIVEHRSIFRNQLVDPKVLKRLLNPVADKISQRAVDLERHQISVETVSVHRQEVGLDAFNSKSR